MPEGTICSVTKPVCNKKAVWRLEYHDESGDPEIPLFRVEYCDSCYNLLKDIFPEEGWIKMQ